MNNMCETWQQEKNEGIKWWTDNMKEGFKGLWKGSSLNSFILETITIGVEDNQSTYSGRVKSGLMSRKRDSIGSRVVEREKFPNLQSKSLSWKSSKVIDVVYLAGNNPPVVAGTYIPSIDLFNLMIWTVLLSITCFIWWINLMLSLVPKYLPNHLGTCWCSQINIWN